MQLHENRKGRTQMTLTELHLFSGKMPLPGASGDSSILNDDSSRKQRILVVDDEELIAHSLRDILTRAGFDTVCALSGTEAIELAGEICPDHAVPFLEIERLRGFTDVDAGIVDENVDPAELPPDALDHGVDRGLVGNISGDGYRRGAGPFELSDRRSRLRFVAPDDRNAGAGIRQSPRHAKANAAIAAGDDGDFAAEIEWCGFHRGVL